MPNDMNEKKSKRGLTLAAAIAAAAYAAGFGTAGSGIVPPIIVQGDAPADSVGWKCEVVGPPLNAKMVCHYDEPGWKAQPTMAAQVVTSWKEETVDGVKVMRPVFGPAAEDIQPQTQPKVIQNPIKPLGGKP